MSARAHVDYQWRVWVTHFSQGHVPLEVPGTGTAAGYRELGTELPYPGHWSVCRVNADFSFTNNGST